MENTKKTIKNLKDLEKVMKLMQDNRVHKLSIDGFELEVNSFKQDMHNETLQFKSKKAEDDELLYYSS